MQGMNLSLTFYRAVQQADDVAGGAQKADYIQYGTGRGRLQQRSVSIDMRAQGLGTDRIFDCFVQPANTDVLPMDMIVPSNGPWEDYRFLVTGVVKPSLAHLRSPMSHLRLDVERWDDGKMIDLQGP
jgi:hypothetical protein